MNWIRERSWLGTLVMLPDQIFFQPHTPAAILLAEFWRLKGQEGLAR